MLTNGGLKRVFEGEYVENLVLQILDIKRVPATSQATVATVTQGRYRVWVSDGVYKTSFAIFGMLLHRLVDEGYIKRYAIFETDRYVCETVDEAKKIVIFLDVTVTVPGETVACMIGKPVTYEIGQVNNGPAQVSGTQQSGESSFAANKDSMQASSASGAHANSSNQSFKQNNTAHGNSSNQSFKQNDTFSPAKASADSSSLGTHLIANLTEKSNHQNEWTICARVTNKSDIHHYNNFYGQGKCFSIDLLDKSGEIRAKAFKEQCDQFYDLVEVNQVYFISQAKLKPADKQYPSLKNDYEMTFTQSTQMWICEEEDPEIPSMQSEFVKISQLQNVEKNTIVDVIGVCKEIAELSTTTVKWTEREQKKRDFQLVDDTCNEICLTVWGTRAEKFDVSLNSIIAAKRVKVSDFNGRSLSALASSNLQINPDIKEAHKLQAWYDNNVMTTMSTTNLSNQRGGASGGSSGIITIREAMMNNLGCGHSTDYYTIKGTLVGIGKENSLYSACPSCNKKVINQDNQLYRCEKCNKDYHTFNWRLKLFANVADITDNVWVTMFQKGEEVLGCKAADLGIMKEEDERAFLNVFQAASFNEFIMKLRVRTETFNDDRRLRTNVEAVENVNFSEYNRTLIQEIKAMAGID